MPVTISVMFIFLANCSGFSCLLRFDVSVCDALQICIIYKCDTDWITQLCDIVRRAVKPMATG